MHRFRIIGLLFVVVLAVAAVTAAEAAAQPIYLACKSGSCPWNAGKESSPALTTKSGAVTITSYIKGTGIVGEVTCRKSKGEGHITGPSSGNLTILFEKCEDSGKACSSSGQKAGFVKTSSLSTELAETKGKVVIRDGKTGAKYAEIDCEGFVINVKGAADGVVTQVSGKASRDAFSVNAGGEQEDTVGGDLLLTELVGIGTVEGAESATLEVKTKEELVIF